MTLFFPKKMAHFGGRLYTITIKSVCLGGIWWQPQITSWSIICYTIFGFLSPP